MALSGKLPPVTIPSTLGKIIINTCGELLSMNMHLFAPYSSSYEEFTYVSSFPDESTKNTKLNKCQKKAPKFVTESY